MIEIDASLSLSRLASPIWSGAASRASEDWRSLGQVSAVSEGRDWRVLRIEMARMSLATRTLVSEVRTCGRKGGAFVKENRDIFSGRKGGPGTPRGVESREIPTPLFEQRGPTHNEQTKWEEGGVRAMSRGDCEALVE